MNGMKSGGLDEMMGKAKAKPSEPAEESNEWTEAGQDLIDAVKSGDGEAAGLVLKRMCGDYEDDKTEE